MKRHLLTRILSITLVLTILSSDIGAYAASDMTGETAGVQTQFEQEPLEEEQPAEEQIEDEQSEDGQLEEIPTEQEELETEQPEETPIEEEQPEEVLEEEEQSVKEEVVTTQNEMLTVELEEVSYLVPEVETSAIAMGMYSLTDGKVSLKSSREINWIDRLDLTDADIIRNFYDLLVEASDNDGENDVLIDDSTWDTECNLTVGEITGTVEVKLSNAADAVLVNKEVGEALGACAEEVFQNYYPYIIAVRDAFDRDHPEVFWLSGETAIGYQVSGRYVTPGTNSKTTQAEYTVTLAMILRDTVERDAFDIRAAEYQSKAEIEEGIALVNSTSKAILDGAASLNNYEKIRYFNKVLTESNEYNTSDDLDNIYHDARECISALEGRIGTDGPVCEAYARAMKVLCDKAGIPCVLVDGMAITDPNKAGEGHMWNYVRLNGSWYGVDVTWNDPTGGKSGALSGYEGEEWLLVGSNTEIYEMPFAQSHPEQNQASSGGVAFTNGPKLSIGKYVLPEESEPVPTGYFERDGKKYYANSNGILQSGWIKIGTDWHYFDAASNFCELESETKDGYLYSLANGNTSYFTNKTTLLKNAWVTHAGHRYYFDENGFAVKGWHEDGNYWYYAETPETATKDSPIGNVVKGVKKIGEKFYGFHATGYYRLTGWQTIGGERYYFRDDGSAVVNSWHEDGGYWYYADVNGCMLKNEELVIEGETYRFDNNYRLITGWQTIGGYRYYFDSKGIMETGLFQVGTYWYYAETEDRQANGKVIPKGAIATGLRTIETENGMETYIFHSTDYYALTGWQTVNGQRYYIKEDGSAIVNEWYQEGDYWYYADENGHLVTTSTEPTEINGEYYYFDSNYRLGTGWKQIGGKMYFFDSVAEEPEECHALDYTGKLGGWFTITKDGRKSYIKTNYQILTGWQTIEGKRYYFNTDGIMQTGLFQVGRYYYYAETKKDSTEGIIAAGAVEIDGRIYGFHPTQYYRVTGWQTFDGERYYFQDDCSAVVNDWYQDGNYYYYADEKGRMVRNEAVSVTDEQTGETATYYFDNNYRLATGWIKVGDKWRFFDNKDNYLECHEIDYAENNGWMTLSESEGRKSYVNASGTLLKGWQTIDGQRYYFDNHGIMETDWFRVGNYDYYAEPVDKVENDKVIPKGAVAKGITTIGMDTYVFHSTGYYRLRGWQTVDGKRFYLDNDGKAKTDLFEVSGKTYYGEETSDSAKKIIKGQLATGAREVGEELHVFHLTQYYMLTGWQTVNGNRYYIDEKGNALVEKWHQDGDYWYYADENGHFVKTSTEPTEIDGKYYYFDSNYRLGTGWKQIGGKMYFFDSVAEKPKECHALDYTGELGGWIELSNGKRSYIKTNSQILTGWQTIGTDRYYFDSTGIALTGEFQIGRYYYYANPQGENLGALVKNTAVIDGNTYGFHPTQYYRLTGWQTLDGQRYYFKEDCSAATGWFTVDGYWCYADSLGKVQKDVVTFSDSAKNYYFDSNYRLTTGWVKIENQWRYFNISDIHTECYELTGENVTSGWITLTGGKKGYIHSKNGILKGWQTIGTGRYYFDNNGILQTGWFTDGTYWYYAQADGCVLKDEQIIDGKKYYFNSSYRLTTGWIKVGNDWRFFDNKDNYLDCYELKYTPNGNWLELPEGRKSYLNASKTIVKGWLNIGEHRYYFDNNGILETDWFKVGNYDYYAEPKDTVVGDKVIPKGAAAKGVKNIGGKIYGFHSTGYYRLTGWQTIGTERYYFDENNQAVTGWYQEGDYWYYADENGCMAKGLTPIGKENKKYYYFDNNYRLSTGWKLIDKKMYFFDSVAENPEKCHSLDYTGELGGWIELSNGKRSYIKTNNQVLSGWQTIGTERYYFDSNGILVTGEFQVGRYYYYAEPTGENVGALAKNVKIIDGKYYGFHPTQYYRLTGWQTLDGARYYFKDDCSAVVNDWYQEGSYYYYADVTGQIVKNQAIPVTDKKTGETQTYYFDSNYRLATGWIKVGDDWRFFDNKDNYLKRYELKYTTNGNWFELSDGRKSYVNAAKTIVKGWLNVGEYRYYFDSNGILETGWFKVGNYHYYAEPENVIVDKKEVPQGAAAKGIKVIDGETYVFHTSSYYRLSGWQTVSGKRFFLDSEGKAITGLFETGGRTYYAKTLSDTINSGINGEVLAGRRQVENHIYVFHPSQYYMLTGWQTVNGQRYYINADGTAIVNKWYQEGDYWYYAQSDGSMAQGRIAINSKWYYFDNNYRLSTGWKRDGDTMRFYDSVAENPDLCYELKAVQNPNGWVSISGTKRSYIKSNYQILTGWQTIGTDRYYFNDMGIALTGDFQIGRYHYYAEPSGENAGALAKNVKKINGKYYGFHPTQYYRLTGWQTLNGQRYYFQDNCSAVIGWYQEGNYRYYADTDGSMLKNTEREIDGQIYKFDNNYRLIVENQSKPANKQNLNYKDYIQPGWFKVGDYWYYGNSNGTVVTGVLELKVGEETKTYYFDDNYRLQTGWQTIGGKKYYIEISDTPESYKMTCVGTVSAGWQSMDDGRVFYADNYGNIKTGWQTIDKQRYYFDATGILKTGWFTVGGKTYYAEETAHDAIRIGTVAQGAKTIKGETYVFHSSQYYMLTGFQSYGGRRYYLGTDGKAKSGWFTVGTDLYYGEKESADGVLKGALAAGAKEIDGNTYFFHATANYRLTGWQAVNGKRYYLDMDGTAKTGWFTVSGKIYYGEPFTTDATLKGTLAAGAKEIEKQVGEEKVSNTYFFHASSNYRLTGWQTINGQRYYLNTDGTAKTGWFTISGKTYYAEPTTKDTENGIVLKGTVAKGKVSVGENTYYFHPSQYYMLTGWQTIDKQRYYFKASGEMEIGWFEVSGYYHYADTKEAAKGIVLKGLQEEIFHKVTQQNQTYYFDNNYRLKTGWQTINSKKYFFENAENPEDCYKTHTGKVIDAGWFELANGQRCYADANGNVKTGWQTIDKQRYYFDANGVLQTGWFKVGNYHYYGEPEAANKEDQTIPVGAVAKGIKEIQGQTYVFHTSQYYMLSGWQTVNGQRFYLEADENTRAKAKTGWFTLSGKTYYAESTTSGSEAEKNRVYKGTVAKGAKSIGTDTYVFHSSQYYMMTGFQSYGGKRYYLQSDGKAKTGWFTVGTDTYYGEAARTDVLKGTLAAGAKEIDGNTYFFHTTANYRLTGWQTVNGQRYYLNTEGIARTGWFTVSGKLYYGEPSTTSEVLKGTLAKGAKVINDKTYVFHTSQYYRLTGWQTVNKERYYLQSDGTAKTGWFTVSGKTYYAEPKANVGIQKVPVGVVASGMKEIDGETYCFHTSQYYMLSGWQTVNGQRFYLEADAAGKAKAKTDWFTISGKTYYAEKITSVDEATGSVTYKGTVAKGAKSIGTDTYVFHSSQYYMLTGFQSYAGKRYYLQKDGTAKTGWFTVGTDLYYGETKAQNDILKGTLAAGAREITETVGENEVKNTYFFHATANYRLTGWQTVNGQRYYLNTDGTAQTGWFTISGKIYYGEPTTTDTILKGTLAKGAKEIAGETYVFHTTQFYRLTGWQTVNGQRYYLNTDGTARTGWFTISGKTYYGQKEADTTAKTFKGTVAFGLTKIGRTVENPDREKITVTETYYFHPSQYYKMTGWQTINKQRYYFDVAGVMATGWFEVSGYDHYANPDGTVVKGLMELPYGTEGSKKIYYFDNNYRLKTGWQTVSGKKYFFENNTDPTECYATVATYEVETGWFELENGQICYANNKGVPLTGWQTIDKQRYYFDANGVLQTGWFKVGNYQYYGETEAEAGKKQEIPVGVLAKGIKIIGEETYCFHASQYYMLNGWQTVNGQRFYLEADVTGKAKAKTGWFTISGKTYYAEETTTGSEEAKNLVYKGTVAKGAKDIAAETYVFHSSQYYMLTGFQAYGGKRYYLQRNGKAKTGWFTVGTDLYYAEPTAQNGALKGALASGAKEIKDETYFFHTSSNYRLTGWQTVNGQRYYLDEDGIARTGWFTISGKIYYGEPTATDTVLKGTLAKGAKEVNNHTYVFHSSQYYRMTGWQTVGTQRFYLNTNGTAKTGWFTVGGKTYYGQKESNESDKTFKGNVAKGLTKVEETETYYFHPSQYYKMTGWQTIGKDRYYFNADGMMGTGWFEVSGYHHYASAEGVVAKGLVELPYGAEGEKKFYYFDNNYRQKTGWYTINGKKYFFTPADTPEKCYATYEGSVSCGWMTMENGQICYADNKGNIKTGWQTIVGRRYYFDANGILKTGWFEVGKYRYYAEPKAALGEEQQIPIGTVANGVKEIDGATYIFHSTQYYPLTGWQTVGDKRYYLQANGKARSGWFNQGGYWYYGAETTKDANCLKGVMEKGLRTIAVQNGEKTIERTYYFDANYRLATGWKVIEGMRYFFQINIDPRNCYMVVCEKNSSGWFEFEDGTKSYFDAKGNPVTGWQTIEGKKYYFDPNGIMQTGWYTINGVEYFFNADGVYIPMTAPTITSLTSTFYKTVDVKWSPISGVQRYVLEYSKNSVFPSWETVSVTFEDTAVHSYRVENLEEDTTYYFRLRYTTWSDNTSDAGLYYSQYSAVKSIKVRGEVAATATSATLSECEIVSGSRDDGITVQLKASLKERIKSADDQYYIVETESYGNAIDLATPVGSVDKAFDIDTTVVIDAGDGSSDPRECVDRALMNKLALAILKDNGTYQVISTPMGITNPEVISENTASILKPMSKKGLQGVGYDDALNTNSKNTLFNLDLASVVGTGPASGYVAYEYKGKTYYFSNCSNLVGEFKNLEKGIMQYVQGITGENNKVCVTLNLLLSYKSSNSYLIDPVARTPGHKYYTMNMREEKARETYEAVFLYLGELFGQSDCYVTHWVLGNEVNSSRAWNYQGSLSYASYMQVYAAAFRLLYNGVKASKTGNNVYISLDNGWTAAPDTYAGKTTLDTFAAYAQNENPDMLWSIAFHGYSYPLTRCDFWNDYTYTTDSVSTRYISMRNIYVLTNYAASLEQKYGKPTGSIRVILSEQGYNAGQGHYVQAQALARGYYMAEFNDRIDAFIIRAIIDAPEETRGGLYLGLQNIYQEKRSAFYTYEFMDSSIEAFCAKVPSDIAWSQQNQNKVKDAQKIVGTTNWESIIPNFNRSKLAAMY